MVTRQLIVTALSCGLLALLPGSEALADEATGDTAERCVSLSRISSTNVVDDYNILFYMRGGDVYLNRLPHRCPGLRQERRFMYRTSLSQLCDLDIITVLNDTGPGFMPGPSCGLGRFYPITKEEAKALKEAPPMTREPEEVPTADPEELDD